MFFSVFLEFSRCFLDKYTKKEYSDCCFGYYLTYNFLRLWTLNYARDCRRLILTD